MRRRLLGKTAKFEQGQLAMAEFMTNMAGNPAPLGNAMLKQAAKQEDTHANT